MDEVGDASKKKKEESKGKGKMIAEEDVVPEPYPILNEEPFLKAIKDLGGKALEGVPLFSGKMDTNAVMDLIDVMENHFDYEGVSEAQKVKVAKSRLRGLALTWWKCVQDERISMGNKYIAN